MKHLILLQFKYQHEDEMNWLTPVHSYAHSHPPMLNLVLPASCRTRLTNCLIVSWLGTGDAALTPHPCYQSFGRMPGRLTAKRASGPGSLQYKPG